MKKYKTIVVSDLHLGTLDSKTKELVEFLDSNSCQTLIMAGDIVDGWALKRGGKWKNKHMKCIRHIMKLSENNTNVIWIRGNHDDFLKDWLGFEIGNFKIVENYELVSNDKKFLVLHGDIFDVFITKMRWLSMIGSRAYDLALFINRVYNMYRKLRKKPYFSISKVMKDNVKKATMFVSNFETHVINLAKTNKYDGIICGHIHSPKIENIDGLMYFNSGDWVENMSALVEHHNGKWELIIYKPT